MIEIDEDPRDDENESEPAPLPEGVTVKEMPLRWSRRRDKFAAALAKAQAEIVLAEKDRTNEHLSSSYSSFGQIREVGRIPLAKNGIALVQGPSVDDKRVTVLTQLVHSSGQWVECQLTFVAEYMKGLNWMQVMGVVITYAKRYTLQALTGVAVREDELDDDGQGIEDHRDAAPRPPRQAAPKIEMPQTYEALLKAIDSLTGLPEARELWRMGQFLPFKLDDDQAAEAKRRHEAKVKQLAAGAAPTTKAQQMGEELAKKKSNATVPAAEIGKKGGGNVICSKCPTEISLNGFVIDTAAVQGGDGTWLCGTCSKAGAS